MCVGRDGACIACFNATNYKTPSAAAVAAETRFSFSMVITICLILIVIGLFTALTMEAGVGGGVGGGRWGVGASHDHRESYARLCQHGWSMSCKQWRTGAKGVPSVGMFLKLTQNSN